MVWQETVNLPTSVTTGSIPVISTMYGEREALVTSGDCKSSTLGYTGFESLALHQIYTVNLI